MTSAEARYPAIIDAIIVGSGAAGLAAALALAPKRVLLLTKTDALASGSTPWAQGGIAAAIGADDSPEDHQQDTIAAGAGLVEAAPALMLTRDGRQIMQRLIREGFPADRKADGNVSLGREGAHGKDRIIHAGGDATGQELHRFLVAAAQKAAHITIKCRAMAMDILTQDGRVTGLQVMDDHGLHDLFCPQVILATGGIGGCYSFSTNPAESTGDGMALAARAGAVISDPEFMQFHPTALAVKQQTGRRGLLTEALRGAGAWLLDGKGHRFMPDEHDLAELAPRDVVARAIFKRLQQGETITLDIRQVLKDKGAAAFPTVVALCKEAGIDPATTPVPIAPAAHYHMGGVETDADGESAIKGLWACGETASTGVHGANRLASNSLLEALVYGERIAKAIKARPAQDATLPHQRQPHQRALSNTRATAAILQDCIYAAAGLIRDKDGMQAGLQRLDEIERSLVTAIDARDYGARRRSAEIQNMLTVGRFVIHAALQREESRGGHARSDFPDSHNNNIRHSRLTQSDLVPSAPDRQRTAAE